MIRWWQRLVRALDQSRIRLPRRPISIPEVQPGDWVQIESRLWRVKARQGRSAFVLETVEESTPNSILLRSEDSFWTLQQGAEHSRLSPSMVIVYPVGQQSS